MIPDATLPLPRYLSVLFADDIRQEVDGKVTIVGVYQAKMLFPQLPAVLPKLAVVMTAVTPADRPFEKLVFGLYKDDEELQSCGMDIAAQNETEIAATASPTNGTPMIEVQFGVILGPLNIEGPCVLRTRVETESGILAGRSLEITAVSLTQNIQQ